MMQDMTDAVRYVLVHAEEWNIKNKLCDVGR